MKNTNTNKILIGVIICLLFFVSLQTCNLRSKVDPSSKITTTVIVDTIHKSHVDTTYFLDIKDSIRWINLPRIDSSSNLAKTEFTYKTDITDSLIAGTVNTKVKSDGSLLSQGITYIPKFPKYITKTDTFWIKKDSITTIVKPTWGVFGGLMVSPYQNLSLIGTLGLKTKKDMYFGVGYEPFRNNIYLDFKVKLFNNK